AAAGRLKSMTDDRLRTEATRLLSKFLNYEAGNSAFESLLNLGPSGDLPLNSEIRQKLENHFAEAYEPGKTAVKWTREDYFFFYAMSRFLLDGPREERLRMGQRLERWWGENGFGKGGMKDGEANLRKVIDLIQAGPTDPKAICLRLTSNSDRLSKTR